MFYLNELIQLALRIYLKYMVGSRCCDRIGEELVKWGMMPEISQGVLDFQEDLDFGELIQLKENLFELGYEVVDPKNSELLDEISDAIRTLIYQHPEIAIDRYPEHLQAKGVINPEILEVCSQVHGMDLIQFATIQQVERIKEMILYEGKKLKEIAEVFQFKNKRQLKKTFERITGLTPEFYKEIRIKRSKIREESGFGEIISAIKEIN